MKSGQIKYKSKVLSYEENGVKFEGDEFKKLDTIIMATGFKLNLDIFKESIEIDEDGFAKRKNRVEDLNHETLFYVGQNYDYGALILQTLNVQIDVQNLFYQAFHF